MYETALHVEAKRRIREIGGADVVVGIPTYRNGRTIGRILEATCSGLMRDFPNARAVIVNADGGSSDNTVQIVTDWPVPSSVQKIVTPYEGLLGRGSAVRAIFETAAALGARVCVVLSPETRDMTPAWMSALIAPVLAETCDVVIGDYDRPPLESALSDHVAYPMLRLLYNVEMRQAVSCDLALRGDLAGQLALRDVWETDIARHGLDVWLLVTSLIEGRRIGQVNLGTKTEGLREFVVPMDPRFLHAVGTLFRLINIYRRAWGNGSPPGQLTCFSRPERGVLAAQRPVQGLDAIWDAALKGRTKYRGTWRAVMSSETLERVREGLKSAPAPDAIPADLWARTVVDFAVVYNRGEGDPDKVVCALLPIYYARVVSFLLAMQGQPPAAFEQAIQQQASLFQAQRQYLRARWDSYVPWMEEVGR